VVTDVSAPTELTSRLEGTQRLTLSVTDVTRPTPRMRRVRLLSADLVGFRYLPGQDLMLWLPAHGDRMLYRRYTIRDLDPDSGAVTLDIAAHGGGSSGPGGRWLSSLEPGDVVEAVGPRGKVSLADAAWHLFIGDESFLPATLVLLESVPAHVHGRAIIEVADRDEEQAVPNGELRDIAWLHRGGRPAGEAAELVAAAKAVDLPAGEGHVYIGGEARVVAAVRDQLEQRGVPLERMSPKAYWGRGRANASRGEPDKLPE
jgi:NADPH-dependent ferric siderophore reductase